jgi:multiple sugar transport system permease protein
VGGRQEPAVATDTTGVTPTGTSPAPAAPSPPGRAGYWRRDRLSGYAFVAPQVIGFVIFLGIPVVLVLWYSLFDWNILRGTAPFVGFENYERMAEDPLVWQVLRNTMVFSLLLVPFNLVLAMVLAVLVDQRLPGTTLFRTLFFAPVVVSLVAWAIVWQFLLQADGGINASLAAMGIDGPNWLRSTTWALPAVVVVQVFKNVGLNMILFLAALQGVPGEVQEAARVDGAGPLQIFRRITLPMIAPTVMLVSIITVIGSFQVFATIAVLTGGGPANSTNVLVYYVYQQAFRRYEAGYASAGAVVLFVIVMILTVLQWQARKRWVFHEQA